MKKSHKQSTLARQGDVQQLDSKATPQKLPQSNARLISRIEGKKKQEKFPTNGD